MKVSSLMRLGKSRLFRQIAVSAALVLGSGLTMAQQAMSLEELEKLVAEQRIALEEAIANRESTAAQAEQVKNDLEEVQARTREVQQELEALCEEQEALQAGSFDECMASGDS